MKYLFALVLLFPISVFSYFSDQEEKNIKYNLEEIKKDIQNLLINDECFNDKVCFNDNLKNIVNGISIIKNINSNNTFYGDFKIIDGDTITVNIDGKKENIRMIGINAPEVRGKEVLQGIKAKKFLIQLTNNKNIKFIKDSNLNNRDKYGRLLRYVYLENEINLNNEMIKTGNAKEYTYGEKYDFQELFKKSQKEAQINNLGIWVNYTFEINTCSTKKYCSQMKDCSEAKYFLNTCGIKSLDRNKDGIPCESICK